MSISFPQLEPEACLKDIINSQAVPVVELNEIFRQAQESLIIVNAHKINKWGNAFTQSVRWKTGRFLFY